MAQEKQQLEALLGFIDKLINEPGNEWFVDKLGTMLSQHQLLQIEKYLGLNYKCMVLNPVVAYEFIDDENVKNRLIADSREMLRYRYGTHSHKIDFMEFCRYVILQIELMLDYYFKRKYSNDFLQFKEDLIEKVPNTQLPPSISTIDGVSLPIKIRFFSTDKDLDGYSDFENARKVRNSQSHRSLDKCKVDISTYRESLLKEGLRLHPSGWLLKDSDPGINAKISSIRGSDEYKQYMLQLWIVNEPFDGLIRHLDAYAVKIKNSLT